MYVSVRSYLLYREGESRGGSDGNGAYGSTISTFLCARFPLIFPLYANPFSSTRSSLRERAAGRDLSVHRLVSMAAYLLFSSPSAQRECRAFLSIVVDFGPRVHTTTTTGPPSLLSILRDVRRLPSRALPRFPGCVSSFFSGMLPRRATFLPQDWTGPKDKGVCQYKYRRIKV